MLHPIFDMPKRLDQESTRSTRWIIDAFTKAWVHKIDHKPNNVAWREVFAEVIAYGN